MVKIHNDLIVPDRKSFFYYFSLAEGRDMFEELTRTRQEIADKVWVTQEYIPVIRRPDAEPELVSLNAIENGCGGKTYYLLFAHFRAYNLEMDGITQQILQDEEVRIAFNTGELLEEGQILTFEHRCPHERDVKSAALVLPQAYETLTQEQWEKMGVMLFKNFELRPTDGFFEDLMTHTFSS